VTPEVSAIRSSLSKARGVLRPLLLFLDALLATVVESALLYLEQGAVLEMALHRPAADRAVAVVFPESVYPTETPRECR
jgi:hypothetical protein